MFPDSHSHVVTEGQVPIVGPDTTTVHLRFRVLIRLIRITFLRKLPKAAISGAFRAAPEIKLSCAAVEMHQTIASSRHLVTDTDRCPIRLEKRRCDIGIVENIHRLIAIECSRFDCIIHRVQVSVD